MAGTLLDGPLEGLEVWGMLAAALALSGSKCSRKNVWIRLQTSYDHTQGLAKKQCCMFTVLAVFTCGQGKHCFFKINMYARQQWSSLGDLTQLLAALGALTTCLTILSFFPSILEHWLQMRYFVNIFLLEFDVAISTSKLLINHCGLYIFRYVY